jgi:hypothetical protein
MHALCTYYVTGRKNKNILGTYYVTESEIKYFYAHVM